MPELSEMTLEELWELFPIVLTEHQSCWKEWYEEEKQSLSALFDKKITIHHIGSTAIEKIWAKPIIDILVEIPEGTSMTEIKELLERGGYRCMSEEENRKSFNKGYTNQGFAERVFHLHLRYDGDHDELYFRDYMNQNPLLAAEYERLKLSLWKKYEHDRDAYTRAKSEFVEKYTRCARIVRLVDCPKLKEQAAQWFHEKWGIPLEAYQESMEECLANKSSVPQWYLAMEGERIVGGMGVIENDFHDRKDLAPNVCAVYTEPDRRCNGIAGKLLYFVCADMKKKGIDTLYLVTDHTSFYERYEWEFLCMVQGDGEPELSRMYVHREQ